MTTSEAYPIELVYASFVGWVLMGLIVGIVAREQLIERVRSGELRPYEVPLVLLIISPAVLLCTVDMWYAVYRRRNVG